MIDASDSHLSIAPGEGLKLRSASRLTCSDVNGCKEHLREAGTFVQISSGPKAINGVIIEC